MVTVCIRALGLGSLQALYWDIPGILQDAHPGISDCSFLDVNGISACFPASDAPLSCGLFTYSVTLDKPLLLLPLGSTQVHIHFPPNLASAGIFLSLLLQITSGRSHMPGLTAIKPQRTQARLSKWFFWRALYLASRLGKPIYHSSSNRCRNHSIHLQVSPKIVTFWLLSRILSSLRAYYTI